jgi:hypothetical protein
MCLYKTATDGISELYKTVKNGTSDNFSENITTVTARNKGTAAK